MRSHRLRDQARLTEDSKGDHEPGTSAGAADACQAIAVIAARCAVFTAGRGTMPHMAVGGGAALPFPFVIAPVMIYQDVHLLSVAITACKIGRKMQGFSRSRHIFRWDRTADFTAPGG